MVKTQYKGVPQRRQSLLSNHRQWANKATDTISVYGDGQDGNVTVTGTTTLTQDALYNNLTVARGGTLLTGGYRLFVKNVLTLLGDISNLGGDSPGGTIGGSAPARVTAGAGGQAMSGASGRGSGGGSGLGGTTVDFLGAAGGAGGYSGSGLNLGGQPDRPSGASFDTSSTVSVGRGIVYLYDLGHGVATGTTDTPMVLGGGGGGGGASAFSSTGGGAGGGGGVVVVSARHIKVGHSGLFTSPGGNGADGSGTFAGGGGGGGGGTVVILCDTYSGPDPYSPGGSGGTGSGAGDNGQDGQDGVFIKRFRNFKV